MTVTAQIPQHAISTFSVFYNMHSVAINAGIAIQTGLDQKRLNIISKRDIIGDSGIGRLVRREKGVPLSYVGMFVDTTNQHDNHI